MVDQVPPRRRFQFRLRTLMIGVTLLAVACWGVVDRNRLIRERDEAREAEQRIKADEVRLLAELNALANRANQWHAELIKEIVARFPPPPK